MAHYKCRNKLLFLLRQLLGWGEIPIEIWSEDDWLSGFRLAQEQAVSGMLFLMLDRLPSGCRPPSALAERWLADSVQILRRNCHTDRTLVALITELRNRGVEPVVVKGQVIGREYDRISPELSMLRCPGDIDIFIIPSQWELVERWIAEKGIGYRRSAAEKHIEITYRDVSVELHYHLNTFSSAKAQRYWEREIEGKVLENGRVIDFTANSSPLEMRPGGCRREECRLQTLGVTETLLHQCVHIHHHLLTEGVGLRQITDMALFLCNHIEPQQIPTSEGRDEEIDSSLLKRHLHGIGHYKAFTAYCALMNKYLGLPKEKILFELDQKDYVYADRIMEEVWRGGNFGHKNNLKGVKPGLLHSLNTARLVINHSTCWLN